MENNEKIEALVSGSVHLGNSVQIHHIDQGHVIDLHDWFYPVWVSENDEMKNGNIDIVSHCSHGMDIYRHWFKKSNNDCGKECNDFRKFLITKEKSIDDGYQRALSWRYILVLDGVKYPILSGFQNDFVGSNRIERPHNSVRLRFRVMLSMEHFRNEVKNIEKACIQSDLFEEACSFRDMISAIDRSSDS